MNQHKNQASWENLKSILEKKKQEVQDEILHYPPPIPACDQQFNYLLEQRALLAQAVRQVNEIALVSNEELQQFAEELGCLDESELAQISL